MMTLRQQWYLIGKIGTTLLCLPDGVHQEDATPSYPSLVNEEMIQALPEVEQYLAQTVRQAIAKL